MYLKLLSNFFRGVENERMFLIRLIGFDKNKFLSFFWKFFYFIFILFLEILRDCEDNKLKISFLK